MMPRPRTLLLAFAFAVSPVLAQAQPGRAADAVAEQHVLEIHDGQMSLDGRPLPAQNLPEGLDLHGIEMTYTFVGPVSPVLEIDGVVYVLEGEHFKRLSETDRAGVQPYFFPEMPEAESQAAPAPAEASEEAYLRQVSERDRALYDRIQREVELENETHRLAARIRSTSDSDTRARLLESLRNKLGEAFELKQAIRAEEIAQAEAQIGELRRLLDERAARKSSIIERRIEELTGER
ncbi:MAG: hypothetical protein R3181_14955 [Rubricoccaceae bacterium]|nr:hypothetical protein [Rubricoccaceae bacterium]